MMDERRLRVTCGEGNKQMFGELNLDTLTIGLDGGNESITCPEFERRAGKGTNKKWARSIRLLNVRIPFNIISQT